MESLTSQISKPSQVSQPNTHDEWIAGRIATLLSHYFQPDNPLELQAAALADWIKALRGFSKVQIENACHSYLKDQPRRRPTPGDIRSKVREPMQQQATIAARGDKMKLTPDELTLLEDNILPTARRWLENPTLADQGRATLAYWGENA